MKKGFLLLGLFALTVVLIPDPTEKSKKILQDQGYWNIKTTGYEPFICGDDMFSVGFEAMTKDSAFVRGSVCSGPTKGFTIRFK